MSVPGVPFEKTLRRWSSAGWRLLASPAWAVTCFLSSAWGWKWCIGKCVPSVSIEQEASLEDVFAWNSAALTSTQVAFKEHSTSNTVGCGRSTKAEVRNAALDIAWNSKQKLHLVGIFLQLETSQMHDIVCKAKVLMSVYFSVWALMVPGRYFQLIVSTAVKG